MPSPPPVGAGIAAGRAGSRQFGVSESRGIVVGADLARRHEAGGSDLDRAAVRMVRKGYDGAVALGTVDPGRRINGIVLGRPARLLGHINVFERNRILVVARLCEIVKER